jgi:hypothetical protein
VRLEVTDRAGNTRRVSRVVTPRAPTVARLTVRRTVSAASARLRVAMRLIRPGRVRVSLERISGAPRLAQRGRVARTTRQTVRAAAPGTVRAALGLRPLAIGRYRLRTEVLGAAGRGEPPVQRIIRIVG